jgi:hypothetical protein
MSRWLAMGTLLILLCVTPAKFGGIDFGRLVGLRVCHAQDTYWSVSYLNQLSVSGMSPGTAQFTSYANGKSGISFGPEVKVSGKVIAKIQWVGPGNAPNKVDIWKQVYQTSTPFGGAGNPTPPATAQSYSESLYD